MNDDSSHYERNLPHRLPPGTTLFITYRLAGSLPSEIVQRMAEEAALATGIEPRKRAFVQYDAWLDADRNGPQWLAQAEIAAIVKQSLHFYAPIAYALHAFCVMSNHVHLVLSLPAEFGKPFFRVLQAQKRFSATQCNRLLGLSGQFWARESYDHVVRNPAEFDRVVAYVLNNPVKAGLIANWQDWPHTYWAP